MSKINAIREKEVKSIEEEVKNCRKCPLWETRTNPVVGEGSLNPKVMFIGEAPGYNEDKEGRPFVGKAGKVLDELLESIGLKREEVYIANVLKCRPPNNRDPKPEEIKACTPYLNRQISIIKPKIICTLGNFATSYILEKFGIKPDNIGKIHGNVYRIKNLMIDTNIIPLYHPAAAIYNPERKAVLIEDFRKIKNVL
jgi:DNA polymerase